MTTCDIRREPRPEISPVPPKREPLIEPGPLARRVRDLSQRAEQNRFPEIPRRRYEQEQAPDVPLDRQRHERHVRSRHHLPQSIPGLRLHREEKQLLHEVGRFRVLSVKDIAQTLYSGDECAARSDLRFLKEEKPVALDIVNARRDGRARPVERIEVVTLTREGEKLARSVNAIDPEQKLYQGLVKPREVEHDAQIYRAYRKEWERIERDGGRLTLTILSDQVRAITE